MSTPADAVRTFPAAKAAAATLRPMTSAEEDVFYPCSDGKPMSDNMWQGEAILNSALDLRTALPDALVAADILVYPEQGNRHNRIGPDVLVALGLGMRKRMTYRVWREGKPPDWVLEVASPSTAHNDLGIKRDKYAAMGVREYWLFDPMGGLYRGLPRLQGLQLLRGVYRPIAPRMDRGVAVIRSAVLSLDVRREGELLRFRDVATGEDIPHHSEEAARAEREAARAEREALERKAAQARVAELEAALRRVQAGAPGKT